MKPERWKELNRLFEEALVLEPGKRAAFLESACGGDSALRQEAESLLACHDLAGSFIATPAIEAAASLLADSDRDSSIRRTIGPYRILSHIASGGMGEVYLAQDTRLGRKVAVKLLPPYFTRDEQRLLRFQREARAASSLNHPNIITIHDIGRDGADAHYIVTEFIDGMTLRKLEATTHIRLPEALNIGIQIASALASAHDAGIVHRDVKPENIMVRPDSLVKVLDFGLAKLTEQRPPVNATDMPTVVSLNSEPGVVMGTAHYMSPEQARGVEVDSRTDIWGLGVVLYEMIAGHVPFEGSTKSDLIVSILEREPPPLRPGGTEFSEDLERVIRRALAKNVEARYQSIRDLLGDLVRISKRLERDGLPHVVTEAIENQAVAPQSHDTQELIDTGHLFSGRTDSRLVRITTIAGYLSTTVRSHKVASMTTLMFVALAVGWTTGALHYLKQRLSFSPAVPGFEIRNVVQLTYTGNATQAAISPDGKYVAYVMDDSGRQSLWSRQIVASSPRPIVPVDQNRYIGLTISPDSNFIYYVVSDRATGIGTLYAVPLSGGTPRRVLEDLSSRITFSPDGRQFAFIRGYSEHGEKGNAIFICTVTDGSTRLLAVRKTPETFVEGGVAWSPDGKIIVCAARRIDSGATYMHLVDFQVASGAERSMSSPRFGWIGRVVWLRSGRGLLLLAAETASSFSSIRQVVEVSYPEGETRFIKKDLTDYRDLSAAADSDAIVTIEFNRVSQIWTATSDDASDARQVSEGVGKYYDISWTPDGKIVYVSEESGSRDIWDSKSDGSGKRQLTVGTQNYVPRVSPDGRHIVFSSDRTGAPHLWRMDVDGNNIVQLTFGDAEFVPSFSVDGEWIYYTALVSGVQSLSKVSRYGGESTRVLDYASKFGIVSPDGRWIACQYLDERKEWRVGIVPAEGGPPAMTFNIPTSPRQNLRWSPDGKSMTYIGDQHKMDNIWSQPLSKAPPRPLTRFSSEQVLSFDWSPDGNRIACLRGIERTDVIYLSGATSP